MADTQPQLTQEELIRLAEVPAVILELYPYWPRKPHTHTVWRWAWQGTRGAKLESIKLMGVVYTSRQALRRFFDSTMVELPATEKQSAKRRRVSTAKRKLRRAGA